MDISIIIVNYNTCELLDNCLQSIYKHTKDIEFEIILVDNDSTDGSKAMLKNKYPLVHLIESNINLGFGRANNLGFKLSSGRNIFLLNSDTLLIENSIKILSDILDQDKSIGAVGAILIGRDFQQVHSYGKFPTLRGKILRSEFFFRTADFNCNTAVDYITGADLMLPRSVWQELDGFDPEFFLYYEETDLQKRMASLGYKRILVPTTKIIHLEGESSKNSNDKSSYINEWKKVTIFKSMMYYMKKHTSWGGYLLLKSYLRLKYNLLSLIRPYKKAFYKQVTECIRNY